jgi:hypothetical protein
MEEVLLKELTSVERNTLRSLIAEILGHHEKQ